MANYTSAQDEYDEYDVLIEGDLPDDLEGLQTTSCAPYDTRSLPVGPVPPLYAACGVAGLLGHTGLAFILVKCKGLRHMENIYFLNLVISNLCFSLVLPFWTLTASHGEILNDPMCKILAALYSVGLYGEVLWNTLLAVQRYLVSCNVRRISTAARLPCRIMTSVLAWGTVILFTLPEFMLYTSQEGGQKIQCSFYGTSFLPADEPFWKKFLTLKMNILGFLFPLFVSLSCYLLTCQERRDNLFKLVFAITVVFLLMWGPYNIVLFLATFKEYFSLHGCRSTYLLDRGVQITKLLATSHCCVNLLLVVLLDKTVRQHLYSLCPWCGSTLTGHPQAPEYDSPQREHRCSSEV
ncbi:PREDICTED: C-C chemokine receptor-like 2 [Condylura cristata]|uniref:C-C chemokine receptor-like 2 n=1 Tax=Condylura cristata TaxID=143302 RepID=UPI000643A33E|nr:PREDICTED: C-C chemokine receptor-like 2 [Condylura cristata]